MFSEKLKRPSTVWMMLVALMAGVATTVALSMGFTPDADAQKKPGTPAVMPGVTSQTNEDDTGTCTTPNQDSVCAPVEVTVPAGKQYNVTVWSTFAAQNPSEEFYRPVEYCASVTGGSFGTTPDCNIPNTSRDQVLLDLWPLDESASSFGNVGPLPEGTYTFFTLLQPDGPLVGGQLTIPYNARTMVRVTDAALPGPPI